MRGEKGIAGCEVSAVIAERVDLRHRPGNLLMEEDGLCGCGERGEVDDEIYRNHNINEPDKSFVEPFGAERNEEQSLLPLRFLLALLDLGYDGQAERFHLLNKSCGGESEESGGF